MKNRTIIGIVCIIVALITTFAVAPLVNKLAESKVDVVVVKQEIAQGHQISESDVEIRSMFKSDIPENTYTAVNDVIGKFADCDMKVGYWLTPSSVVDTADNADDIFCSLDGTKQAMSITINTFAGGLSGKLKNGDIVSLVVQDTDNEATIPDALTYVKVITTTTAEGWDKDEIQPNEDGTYELPSTITLLVNPFQAKMLTKYENNGNIHAVLVYRGDESNAKKFLDVQDKALSIIESNLNKESENETEDRDTGMSIIDQANDIIWNSGVGSNG